MKKTPKKSSRPVAKSAGRASSSTLRPGSMKFPKKNNDLTSVYIAILALIVIVVVFFLAYLSKMSKLPQNVNGTSSSQQVTIAGDAMMSGTQQGDGNDHQGDQMTAMQKANSVPAGSRVKFKIDNFKKLALQPLEFEVFDEAGKAYAPADLKTVSEHNMHFYFMSSDLHNYQHLHPTFENGKWKILANVPDAGTYYAYISIAPVKGDAVVLRSTLVAQKGTNASSAYPGATPNLFALNNGFKVQLSLSQNVALQQTVLSYNVTQSGKPVALSNYLGEPGHLVIVRESAADSFMHVHPLDSSDAKSGKVEFMTTFVRGGRYTAFVEFKVGTKVYAFPITFDING